MTLSNKYRACNTKLNGKQRRFLDFETNDLRHFSVDD